MIKHSIINIVFISDNGYALPTGVAINSLRINRKKDIVYDIYLLCNKISDDNKQRFSRLAEEQFNIKIIEVEGNKLFNNLTKSYSKVTTTSLYKFLISDILPELDKVIYIDGDVIIQSDLQSLFATDISNYYAAVVKDGPRKKVLNGGKKHFFSAEPTYFNSGMMVLNLKLLREENASEKLIDYRLTGYNYFMDQDAFNIVFRKRVKYLPYQYNLLLHILTPFWEMNSIEQISEYYDIPKVKTKEQYFDEAKIIHFTFDKPWKYYDIPQSEKWMEYYRSSSFSDIHLARGTYLTNYHNSKSYLIGRIITYIPRKIKFLIKSLREG